MLLFVEYLQSLGQLPGGLTRDKLQRMSEKISYRARDMVRQKAHGDDTPLSIPIEMLREEGLDQLPEKPLQAQTMLKGFARFVRKIVSDGKGTFRSVLEEDTQAGNPNGPCLLLRHLATDGLLMTLTESGVQQTIFGRDSARVERLRTLEKVLADFLEKRTAKFQLIENPEQPQSPATAVQK